MNGTPGGEVASYLHSSSITSVTSIIGASGGGSGLGRVVLIMRMVAGGLLPCIETALEKSMSEIWEYFFICSSFKICCRHQM